MSHSDERDPPGPEDQDALRAAEAEARAALDALEIRPSEPGGAISSGPVPRSVRAPQDLTRWLTQSHVRPSFFPDESPEQSRAFVTDLVPSIQPGPKRPHAFSQDSGLYATDGMRTSEDGEEQEISTVVLLHTREEESAPRRSARPGLMSSLLGQERTLESDEGAAAALRTLPRRMRKETRLPLVGAASALPRARLLTHLAERSQGAHAAKLRVAAAELYARHSEPDKASAAHEAAYAADPSDVLALRRHLSDRLRAGDVARVGELLREQSRLALSPEDRALTLCALAEAERNGAGGWSAAEAAILDAREAHAPSLIASLLQAELYVKSGRPRQAAQALQQSAEVWRDSEGRAALLVEAGRLLEHCGEPEQALALHASASAAAPLSFASALGAYRCCRALQQIDGAEGALQTLANAVQDDRLRAELLRQRARLLHDVMGRPDRALSCLEQATSLASLRAAARAAEAKGDHERQQTALEGWAKLAGGSERALALIELAAVQARLGTRDIAERSLREAALSGAPSGLLGLAREALARAAGDVVGLARAASGPNAADTLRAAAKLARDANEADQELELLVRATAGRDAQLLAEVLALDVAAEIGDLEYLQGALARAAAGLPGQQRVGPLLALLDLQSSDPASGDPSALFDHLQSAGGNMPVVLRRLAAAQRDPASIAALWLQEAAVASGDHAAFAATQAGRYLEAAGADPVEAYTEALDLVRGYPPACFALEAAARRAGDVLALERAHRELASTTPSVTERAARLVRLSLLSAETDGEAASRWLDQAAASHPRDLLLSDLLVRLSADGPAGERAARVEQAARLETAAPFVRALTLRAAAACEDAGQWAEAAAHYRQLLTLVPDDAFAMAAWKQVLHHTGDHATLVAESERMLLTAASPEARAAALQTLAEQETLRGEPGRARMALETILEAEAVPAEAQLAALRGLQRTAMQEGDVPRLLAATKQLSQRLSDEPGRAAELRLALRCAESLDPAAFDTLLIEAQDLVRHELWYALALEAYALRNGERALFYEAARTVSSLLTDATERASYALRAAEAFEAAAPARAASELSEALLGAPRHPLAIEELGRLHRAAGDPRTAAEIFERAATVARSGKHTAQLYYAAGVLFQDDVADRQRASLALQRVVDIDVMFGDAFARLRSLLQSAGDQIGLLRLLQMRIAAGADATLACGLHAQRAQLHLALSQREDAKAAYAAAVTADSTRADLLRALADLHLSDAEYRPAAEVLIQLARVATDHEVLAFAFYQLGVIYDEHLPDPRRAEIAFTRVVSLSPDDVRPVERLIALWKRTQQPERALRALQHLAATRSDVSEQTRYLIALAQTLQEQGDDRGAEQTLDQARRTLPTSVPVLMALKSLYERQGDREALTIHLSRSCHALRAVIEEQPSDPSAWLGLIEMLEARERPDGATLVALTARALGVMDPKLAALATAVPGLGAQALHDFVLRKIALRDTNSARSFFRALHDVLSPLLPCEASALTPLGETHSQAVHAAQELFELTSIALHGTSSPLCVPIEDEPVAIAVNETAWQKASEAERFFLLTRAIAISEHGLTLVARAAAERLLLVVHAAKHATDPRHSVAAVDLGELAELSAQLTAALPAPLRAELPGLLVDLSAAGEWNPRRTKAHALDFGARVALCVTGDVQAASHALLRLKGREPSELTAQDRQNLARTDPQLRALLSFAVSEAYLEARREALTPATRDPS